MTASSDLAKSQCLPTKWTKDIPFAELADIMAPEYNALQVFLDPSDFGHTGMRRARTFIFFQHCETCEYLKIMLEFVVLWYQVNLIQAKADDVDHVQSPVSFMNPLANFPLGLVPKKRHVQVAQSFMKYGGSTACRWLVRTFYWQTNPSESLPFQLIDCKVSLRHLPSFPGYFSANQESCAHETFWLLHFVWARTEIGHDAVCEFQTDPISARHSF